MKQSKLTLALILAWLAMPAFSQQQHWVNQDYLTKQMPQAQYQAIGRGVVAQCRSDGQLTVEQTLPPISNCQQILDRLGDYNPSAYMQCQAVIEGRNMAREQLYKDLVFGCMAKQGWIYQ